MFLFIRNVVELLRVLKTHTHRVIKQVMADVSFLIELMNMSVESVLCLKLL